MKIENIEINKLPSVDFEDRNQLPEVSGIYFAIDSNDNIQYIGRSININQRWKSHHRTQQLSSFNGVRIAYLEVSDTSLLDDIEQALINYFDPYLNGTGNSCKNKYEPDKYQVITYVSFELKKAFREQCKQNGQSVSSVLRKFIIDTTNNTK